MEYYIRKFSFGGITFEINSELPLAEEHNCRKFLVENDVPADYIFEVIPVESEDSFAPKAERNGKRYKVYAARKYISGMGPAKVFVAADAAHVFPENDSFILHASYIVHEGCAVLFTAPSGTGKSTQAEYWRDKRGAEVINGDRVLITKRNGEFFANGVYVAGTSGICENVSAPIKNVIILEQGQCNELVPLKPRELFLQILCQCTFDINSINQYEQITGLVSDLINTVPVNCYRCRNNPDSVEDLERLLWNRK